MKVFPAKIINFKNLDLNIFNIFLIEFLASKYEILIIIIMTSKKLRFMSVTKTFGIEILFYKSCVQN